MTGHEQCECLCCRRLARARALGINRGELRLLLVLIERAGCDPLGLATASDQWLAHALDTSESTVYRVKQRLLERTDVLSVKKGYYFPATRPGGKPTRGSSQYRLGPAIMGEVATGQSEGQRVNATRQSDGQRRSFVASGFASFAPNAIREIEL